LFKRKEIYLLDEVRKFISKVNELKDTCIIVEGKEDLIGLRQIGVSIPILTYNTPKFNLKILKSPWRRFIILTDWDDKGNNIYRRIRHILEEYGYYVDEYFRDEFRRLTTQIKLGNSVEEICKGIFNLSLMYQGEV